MVLAYGMVCLLQNPSTGNGQIPGSSFILSVGGQLVEWGMRLFLGGGECVAYNLHLVHLLDPGSSEAQKPRITHFRAINSNAKLRVRFSHRTLHL